MEASKHTPGPWTKSDRLNGPFWHISSGHSVGGQPCVQGRQAIATVCGESKRGAKAYAEMFEANARLIAAAPELLDAADMALNTLIGCCVSADGVDDRKTILETKAMLRAAIAKATGASHE